MSPDSTPTASADFSIAAVKSATPASMSQSAKPFSADLPAALLRAAVAFSTSVQLSEQLLSSGIMAPIAALLNTGSVHDHHTCLAVDLLWNLLEAWPVSDANTTASSAAVNSQLAARHSQILQPRHKTPGERSNPAPRDDEDLSFDAEKVMSSDGRESTTDAEQDLQDEDDRVSRVQSRTDEASMQGVGASNSEQAPAELELAAAEKQTNSRSTVAGSAAGKGADADTAAVSEQDPVADDTEAAVYNGGLDSVEVAAVALSQTSSNSRADDGSTASDPATEADDSAMTDHQDTDTSSAAHKDAIEDDIAGGLVRVLTDCLENGYSTADKELRNTVLIVSGLLAAGSRHRAALCCNEMLQQLLLAATEPELGDRSTAYLRVRCTLISNIVHATYALPLCFAAACFTAAKQQSVQHRHAVPWRTVSSLWAIACALQGSCLTHVNMVCVQRSPTYPRVQRA